MTKYDQIYSSDVEDDLKEAAETKELVPSVAPSFASSKLTTNSRMTGGRSAMVKAKIRKPKKRNNEVAQPLPKDVILGKVDYDGSMDASEATLDDIEERTDDMYGDRAK